MAYDFEAAKNSLDILNQVFKSGSTFSDASNILTVSGTMASVIPVVGAVLGLIGSFRPDGNHNEIISRFDQLDKKIDQLSRDIEQLKLVIRWDITELQYADHVDRIKSGMTLCLAIGKSRDEEQRKIYQKRLKELCEKEVCSQSLNAILNGVIGNSIFRSSSIMDKYYDVTRGHRPRVSFLGTRLVQVLYGGTMVLSTYETMVHGGKEAADNTKPVFRRLNEAFNKIKSVLDRCTQNSGVNMLNDLNVYLDKGGSNKGLVTEISNFMREKYDWLETYCVVYNDLHGFAKHCISGYQVTSLHRNRKCGIIFLRAKGVAPKFSNRYAEANKIVNDAGRCDHAKKCHDNIAAKISQRGIQYTGCAVIRENVDLCTAGHFSANILLVNKYRTIGGFYTARVTIITAKVILLLN